LHSLLNGNNAEKVGWQNEAEIGILRFWPWAKSMKFIEIAVTPLIFDLQQL
jgi:hypothetical protein